MKIVKQRLTFRKLSISKSIVLTGVFIALTAALIAVHPKPSKAIAIWPTRSPQLSGLIGLTAAQSARLNAVNMGDGSVRVVFSFYRADGSVAAQSTQTVGPGQSASFSISAADLAPPAIGAVPGPAQCRGVIQTLPAVQTPGAEREPPDPCIATLEVIAPDGSTAVLDPVFYTLPAVQDNR